MAARAVKMSGPWPMGEWWMAAESSRTEHSIALRERQRCTEHHRMMSEGGSNTNFVDFEIFDFIEVAR